MRGFVLIGCLVVLVGCVGKGKSSPVTGGLTTGAITEAVSGARGDPGVATMEVPGAADRTTGVELRGYMAGAIDDVAIPNAYGFAVRQLGTGVQTSLQTGYLVALPAGRSTVFGRLMFDLLSWTRLDEDHTVLSGLSPTLDIGIAPLGHGICISASGTWDVHFNDPDRVIVGGYVGLCGGAMKR